MLDLIPPLWFVRARSFMVGMVVGAALMFFSMLAAR
jgi:hypothetical protein